MSTNMKIGEIYDDLCIFKSKLVFLVTANRVIGEQVCEGNIDLFEDDVSGNYMIGLELEQELKKALSKLDELMKKD